MGPPPSYPPKHSRGRYLLLKSALTTLRPLLSLVTSLTEPSLPFRAPADERTTYPSGPHFLAGYIYLPPSLSATTAPSSSPSPTKPLLPIHISLHGSGFCIPAHGADYSFCRHLADSANCVVLDADHGHAPERPFPAVLDDIKALVHWIESAATQRGWDASRISIVGFSSGGNVALAAAADPSFADGQSEGEGERKARSEAGVHSGFDTAVVLQFVSPAGGGSEGSARVAAAEGTEMVERLRQSGCDVEEFEAPGMGHAWDLQAKKGEGVRLREEAYRVAARRVGEAFGRERLVAGEGS